MEKGLEDCQPIECGLVQPVNARSCPYLVFVGLDPGRTVSWGLLEPIITRESYSGFKIFDQPLCLPN